MLPSHVSAFRTLAIHPRSFSKNENSSSIMGTIIPLLRDWIVLLDLAWPFIPSGHFPH
jgi:hypothetical protein